MNPEFLLPLDNEIVGSYAIILLFAGMYVSIKLRFPQFKYFLLGLKILTGVMDDKGVKGQIVQSQGFYAGAASSILFGTIIGSAFALSLGGVGVLFWIWVIGFLLAPLKIVSSTMAIKFRTKTAHGRYLAGPMYFIEKALKANWLAIAFAILSLCTVLTLGGGIQIISMTYISHNVFGSRGLVMPILATAILTYINLGGIRRLGKFAGYFVPFGLILFFTFFFKIFDLIPFLSFLESVFLNAFQMQSLATGGIFGLLVLFGQALGSFFIATEMGLGKSAGISGAVRTDYPIKHGLVSMLQPIFEAIVISTLTFYALFSHNAVDFNDQLQLLRSVFSHSNTISGILFSLSFIILGLVSLSSWFHVGQENSFYISGEKFSNLFRIIYLAFILGVSYVYLKIGESFLLQIFNLGYTLAILTSIPILVSLVILVKTTSFELNKYLNEKSVRYEILKDLYILLLSILPKNIISKLFGMFTYLKLPRFMMIPILKAFASIYKINLSEAELNISEYNSLNQFFTRALKAGVRIIDSQENAAVSPVDARITNFGDINESTLIQAKGFDFSLKELLGSEKYWREFENGKFITFYLSPQDYHRIHSPFGGRILGYYYEPGKLFPVNDAAVGGIQGLFPKNERLITFLQTSYGKIAVVKVGASNVGKIRVTYDDKIVTNTWIRFPKEHEYTNVNIMIDKGSELGRFEMGSTVILIFQKGMIELSPFEKEFRIRFGATIGNLKKTDVNVDSSDTKIKRSA